MKDNNTKVFWPQDLLANDIPNARIMTWSYDAAIPSGSEGGFLNLETIRGHANSLAQDLTNARSDHGNNKASCIADTPTKHVNLTPSVQAPHILFIGHNLGGIIIKRVST